jgi:hypothetical protein
LHKLTSIEHLLYSSAKVIQSERLDNHLHLHRQLARPPAKLSDSRSQKGFSDLAVARAASGDRPTIHSAGKTDIRY